MTDGFTPRPAFPVRSGSVPARPAFPVARGEPVVDVTLDRDQEAKRAIEAVVLAATEPVEPRVLAELVELPVARVEQLCTQLAAEYDDDRRGFVLARVAGGYRFQTHPDLAPYVEHFVLEGQHVRLSGAALETLAIVAYKQPISRGQISAIRGVNVESTLSTLIRARVRGGVRARPRPRPRRPLRHDDVVPRTPGPRLVARTAAAGRLRPRRERRRGARTRAALSDDPTVRRGDGCNRARSRIRRLSAANQNASSANDVQKVLARAARFTACLRGADRGGPRRRRRPHRDSRRPDRRREPSSSRSTVCRSSTRTDLVYYLLNKPARVVTTAHDPEGRRTVVELVPGEPRVFPVGRLDFDTEGMLLLTNDGDLAQLLTHPRYGIDKVYLAEVDGVPAAATFGG